MNICIPWAREMIEDIALRCREVMQRETKDIKLFRKALAWTKLVVQLVELVEQCEEKVVRT